ncbi:hypothetical protein [Erythrobacter sp.]|uniref:hypothetical protein n=1 Tax=Erythrobacter sp. TaxID=1042 RepID=UPI00142602A6|nr:hypothetical protein [Erythrobacter sp.]QIQ86643.1 MAG: hypothetical protein G9473_08055 [Erythrobacter sp.]
MIRRFAPLALAPLFALAACGSQDEAPARDPLTADPLLAAALNDPLMVDPDLSWRNEANAAVTIPASHALPPLTRSDEAALAAREAARLELLEEGSVPDLPSPAAHPGPSGLADARTAPAMLEAAGAPAACAERLDEGFAFAADLPDAARIMPHGMVQQAAGGGAGCEARVIRYLTPAAAEDALQYHVTRAARAGLSPKLFEEPERSLAAADGEGEDGVEGNLIVAVRPGPGGMSAVDLVWWRR